MLPWSSSNIMPPHLSTASPMASYIMVRHKPFSASVPIATIGKPRKTVWWLTRRSREVRKFYLVVVAQGQDEVSVRLCIQWLGVQESHRPRQQDSKSGTPSAAPDFPELFSTAEPLQLIMSVSGIGQPQIGNPVPGVCASEIGSRCQNAGENYLDDPSTPMQSGMSWPAEVSRPSQTPAT
jgi:hypothetical protein